ncbi:MAG: prolyl oligopeptidase family serine peptidase [Acidobacteria bacterium]|nr:prolyl oligopeptidase family serine peptidase [Acidobacteriota bacterium]
MRLTRLALIAASCGLVVSLGDPVAVAQSTAPATARAIPAYQQFLSPASPLELVAAKNADRVAWVTFEEGKRNAYTAAAPSFAPVRLTSFLKDDGVDMSAIQISDAGAVVAVIRGTAPNRDGWVANASADPDGPERAVWAARTAGGQAFRVTKLPAGGYALAPDGSSVLFVKEGQIYRAKVTPVPPASARDRGEEAFITAWGVQSAPTWSPDGRKIAFVSTRTDHSFILVYDMATRKITYMAPSVDFDSNPMWAAEGRNIVFVRRPGYSFAQAEQSASAAGGRGGMATAGGRGRGATTGGGTQAPTSPNAAALKIPGLTRATFKGGYTYSFWKADIATGEAREVWHNQPGDMTFTTAANMRLAGDSLVFRFNLGGRGAGRGQASAETPAGPVDEWDRYYALSLTTSDSKPALLTTTDGLIEDGTSVQLSADSKTLYYCTNAKDIERRHIWAVPIGGGTPVQVTTGAGIETSPLPLASGMWLATLSAGWKMPQSVGVWKLSGASSAAAAAQKIVFPTSLKNFPADLHVEPQIILTKAPDGLEIHNQLFLPKDLKPGERRAALIFVHGGPQRQMMPGYHYMQFYHWAYAINQWLASQGYIVMSVNYRLGIGYGRSFRAAANTGAAGNSEYQDVLAGAKYLQTRPDVDPQRVGIWGLSYGGLLTGQALARNSDVFKAGVDLAGVHLRGSALDPETLGFKSSVVGAIDGWTSPVLLVHGDDDRNVAFSQTTGLVQLLRQRNVYMELIVFPDDTHESMLHSRWMYTLGRMETFLKKFLDPTKR